MGCMEMFPDNYEEFINQYSTKETKFGVEYIPTIKAKQAMSHYLKYESGHAALEEAIAENPYLVMSVCLEAMHQRMVDEVTENIEQKFAQKKAEWVVNQPIKVSDDFNLDILYKGFTPTR